jgi:hypothetical protein
MPDLAESHWLPVNDPCTVCGSSSEHHHAARYPGLPQPFEMRRCRGCGLLFNSPRVEDLSPPLRADYYVFQETETARYDNAFPQVKRHLDPALTPAAAGRSPRSRLLYEPPAAPPPPLPPGRTHRQCRLHL